MKRGLTTIELAEGQDLEAPGTTCIPGSSATKRSGSTSQLGNKIPESIAPRSTELVIYKPKATAFFDTNLNEYLRSKEVDCLVVVGCTTSGCVRATAVDGFNYGFKVFVVEEGVFDRYTFTHYANLIPPEREVLVREMLGAFSRTRVLAPASAEAIAAVNPAAPAPTTTTSCPDNSSLILLDVQRYLYAVWPFPRP